AQDAVVTFRSERSQRILANDSRPARRSIDVPTRKQAIPVKANQEHLAVGTTLLPLVVIDENLLPADEVQQVPLELIPVVAFPRPGEGLPVALLVLLADIEVLHGISPHFGVGRRATQ